MMETALKALASRTRVERNIDTGLTYDGIQPVHVQVSKRESRYRVSDEGAAVAAADVGRVAYPEQIIFGRHSVNVSRQGVVWLPAVAPSDEWLTTICELVARGSVALYEQLLEFESS